VGGVIKMVQALRHEMLPKTLHVDELSPHVDWTAGSVRVLTEAESWTSGSRVRRAGVSSFGISGTNAHVILEEAPLAARDERTAANPAPAADAAVAAVPLVISAKSAEALRGQAARLRSWLAGEPDIDLSRVARALLDSRALLDRRGVVAGVDRQELLAGLATLAAGAASPHTVATEVVPGTTAFLFTGGGAQRVGMGAGLYRAFPVFATALDEVCAEFDRHLGGSLREVMFTDEAGVLDRMDWMQPALFAFEVAMFRLLESYGLLPDVLAGHSLGELVAAYVSGVWSLADACALVAARGRLMGAAPAGGAMLAAAVSDTEAEELLTGLGDRLALGAVNGPESVVFSGYADAVAEMQRRLTQAGRKNTLLRISHASHSMLMEPILEEFRAVAEGLTYREPTVPIVSNVSGARVGDEVRDPGYWVAQVRSCVRFAPGVRSLLDSGVRRFVEVGPDAALTAMTGECLAERPEVAAKSLVAASSRRSVDEVTQFVTLLGQSFAAGVPVDLRSLLPGGDVRVSLPTYAFQRRRYWVQPAPEAVAGSFGHPLLTSAVPLAGKDEWLFTGRCSARTQPWISDHAVFGSVLLPGTAFAEMALAAGAHLDVGGVDELLLQAPLLLTTSAEIDLQLSVGAPDEEGRRSFAVHSRAAEPDSAGVDAWVQHASGVLTAADDPAPVWSEPVWPPSGAEPSVGSLYDRLAERGFDYGPGFQGVTALWTRGQQTFAEVSLDESVGVAAASFGIHPALLDACLHAALGDLIDGLPAEQVLLPFSFAGVRLWRSGVTAVRVRVGRDAEGRAEIDIADDIGTLVARIDAVLARPVAADALATASAARRAAPLHLRWMRSELPALPAVPTGVTATMGQVRMSGIDSHYADVAEVAAAEEVPAVVVWSPDESPSIESDRPGDSMLDGRAGVVRHATMRAWELLRSWLSTERLADTRLVVATRRTTGLDGEPVDLATAAVTGLVRSAQSEQPGRIVLLDHDGDLDADLVLGVTRSGHAQVAVRAGEIHLPRLSYGDLPADNRFHTGAFGKGTVLITGGTSGVGAVIARHLVTAHGIGHLLLVSRRGAAAHGVADLVAELELLGARTRVAACDVADRAGMAAVLESIGNEHPLTAVVHSAGLLDDATIETLTERQIDRVLAPKVDGALILDELTRGHDLAAFVVFSSAAAILGSPGQGNYAAANAVLDGLAHARRAQGLPALSVAWGLWNQGTGMTGEMDPAALARLERMGLRILGDADGTALFDAAVATDAAVVACVEFDKPALAAQARAGLLPEVLSGLVPSRARRTTTGSGRGGLLADRLAAAPEDERDALVVDFVREHAAAVLGFQSSAAIDPETPFQEMGFDSLGGVELRNRLSEGTGTRLPSTLVFNYPTVSAVAKLLRSQWEATATSSAIDDQIAALTALFATLPSEEDKARLAERIRATLTDAVDGPESEADSVGAKSRDAVEAAATADELFALIDQQITGK
jgi:acyl transferase domain-containing protein/acyl carrier protein